MSKTPPEENKLHTDHWLKAKAGDKDAFKKLFDLFYTDLVKYAYNYTRQQVVSEEIVQEIFISVWERRRLITLKSSVKAYLSTAVRYRTINYLRNQLPRERELVDIENAREAYADEIPGEDHTETLKKVISQAMATLPDRCRTIFLLSRYDGLSHKEIAEQLHLSVKTVENQVGIATKKLRKSLQKYRNLILALILLKNICLPLGDTPGSFDVYLENTLLTTFYGP